MNKTRTLLMISRIRHIQKSRIRITITKANLRTSSSVSCATINTSIHRLPGLGCFKMEKGKSIGISVGLETPIAAIKKRTKFGLEEATKE